MNHDPKDHPDFTAYALGEATLEQSTRVRRQLAEDPKARASYDELQATIDALQQAPAPPRRSLHPRQRDTVLAMSQLKSLPPATLRTLRPVKQPAHMAWQIGKIAIAACVAVGAFFVGQRFATPTPGVVAEGVSVQPPERIIPEPSSSLRLETDLTPPAPTADMPPQVVMQNNFEAVSGKAVLPQPPLPQPPASANVPAVAKTTTPDEKSAPAAAGPSPQPPAVAATAQPPKPASTAGFTLAIETATSHFVFKPNAARRLPHGTGLVLASPAPVNPSATPKKASNRSEPQPFLEVHSWKAEVSSCPWDAGRRLMRLVVQIPVEQPAFEFNEADYQLQAVFDPSVVKAYRLVAEKHIRPGSDRLLATRIVWYEFVPTEKFNANEQAPATVGNLSILQPRGAKGTSTEATDALPLMDRGTQWTNAREDFIFETAMVGFGLLLQGTENIGSLNHDLVLDLAKHSSAESPKGERSRFIQSVQQARNAAGL